MDGTHMKDLYCMTILSLVTLDGNNQIVPLSWAVVPTEDSKNWRWFLQKVARYIPLDEEDSVIMSDRGKELVAAVDEIFPNAVHDIILQKMLRQTASQKSVSDYSGVRHLQNQRQPLMLYLLRSEQKIRIAMII